MACYMGPTAGVSEILEKLSVIFGTVTSFDMLMQNFYKNFTRQRKGAFICDQVRGHLKPNSNPMPLQNSQPQGARTPQRLTIPWS